MPHNGGIFQTGFNFLQIGGDYPFLNLLKTAQTFNLNGTRVDPSNLNGFGYIINTPGSDQYGTVFFIPKGVNRTGNYVIKWDGGGAGTVFDVGFMGTIETAGTNIGANGRFKITTNPGSEPYDTGRVVFRYKNPVPNNIVTNIRFVHVDDEALLDSGEVFSPNFKSKIILGGFGVLRNLDWMRSNPSILRRWQDRVPVDHICYNGEYFAPSLWAGQADKVGTAYSVAKSGFSLTPGVQVIVRWGANGTVNGNFTFADTMNVNGTGDVPLKNSYGNQETFEDALNPDVGMYSLLTYDADLQVWCVAGGSSATGDAAISGQVPYELFIRLCVEVGAHPYFCQPYMSSDPVGDLFPTLAAYVDTFIQNPANNATWMVPRYELVSNENWNFGGAFPGTRLGWEKANKRWNVVGDTHNYHGRAFSLNAAAIWSALGVSSKQPNRFHLICGVQTFGDPTASAPRMTSARHVADAPGVNKPASDYATHIACATYFGIGTTFDRQTQELALAMQYDAATTDEQRDALAVSFVALMSINQSVLNGRYAVWKAYATTYGCELTGYEGGYSPDYTPSNMIGNITGVVRGATTQIICSDRLPTVGLQVSYANVGGTTGLNGNTYTVLSVGADRYTINADSTAMNDYVFAGNAVATYLNTKKPVNNLRYRGKQVDAVKAVAKANIESFIRYGGRWYPKFMFCGDDFDPTTGGKGQVWAGYFPDIYGTRCKEMDAHAEFNSNPVPMNFKLRF